MSSKGKFVLVVLLLLGVFVVRVVSDQACILMGCISGLSLDRSFTLHAEEHA